MNGSEDGAADEGRRAQVLLIYPPTPEPTFHSLMTTMVLVSLLTLSICGNFSQLALQFYWGRLRVGRSDSSPNCTQLYIGILHVVQFGIALSLPSVIVDHLVQIWMFGMITCASHFLLINVGRTASAWLIVFLFYDQVQTNSYSRTSEYRPRRTLQHMVVFVAFMCFISVFPAFKFIKLVEQIIQKDHSKDMTIHIRTFKCLTSFGHGSQRLLINANAFLLDYVAPLVVCTVLAAHVLWHARTHRMRAKVLQRRIQNIRVITAAIFFTCHAPHWMAVGCVIIADYTHAPMASWQSKLLGDAALFGPYLMPALVWMPLSALSAAAHTQAKFYEHPAAALSPPSLAHYYGRGRRTHSGSPTTDYAPRMSMREVKREQRRLSLGAVRRNRTSRALKYVRMQSVASIQGLRRHNGAAALAEKELKNGKAKSPPSRNGSPQRRVFQKRLPRMVTVDVTAV